MQSSAIEVIDPGFRNIVDANAQVEKVVSGFQFTEGPVFSRIGYLLFSDIPANRILKYERGKLDVFRENSGGANGLTFDHQGRLLTCEGKAGRVTRTEKDGKITVLASGMKGPNDLVYSIDGSVHFSDLPGRTVYQVTRKGEVRPVARDVDGANGVALSPNQLILYVAARKGVWAYDVAGDGSLSSGRLLAETGRGGDGIKTDEAGNIYVAVDSIWVLNASGKLLGKIHVPEGPSNCNWGAGFRGLYITARTSVYHVPTRVPGTRTY